MSPEERAAYNTRTKATARLERPGQCRAQKVLQYAVRTGKIPKASTLACWDCLLPACEYDHYLGYGLEHRLDVQPVCRSCHGKRTRAQHMAEAAS